MRYIWYKFVRYIWYIHVGDGMYRHNTDPKSFPQELVECIIVFLVFLELLRNTQHKLIYKQQTFTVHWIFQHNDYIHTHAHTHARNY